MVDQPEATESSPSLEEGVGYLNVRHVVVTCGRHHSGHSLKVKFKVPARPSQSELVQDGTNMILLHIGVESQDDNGF